MVSTSLLSCRNMIVIICVSTCVFERLSAFYIGSYRYIHTYTTKFNEQCLYVRICLIAFVNVRTYMSLFSLWLFIYLYLFPPPSLCLCLFLSLCLSLPLAPLTFSLSFSLSLSFPLSLCHFFHRCSYHIYLIFIGQTTNEQLRAVYEVNKRPHIMKLITCH